MDYGVERLARWMKGLLEIMDAVMIDEMMDEG